MEGDVKYINILKPDGTMKTMAAIEREVIEYALKEYKNRSEVARRLKIGRSSLYRWIDLIKKEG